MTRLKWMILVLVACCGAALVPSQAAPSAATYDFIMVGDSHHAADVKLLHDARVRLEKIRSDLGLSSEELPVDKYDASKPGQLAAIQRLGIPSSRLPFIGFCRTSGPEHLPVKVVWGTGPVGDLDTAIAAATQAAARAGFSVTVNDQGPAGVTREFFTALVNSEDSQAWRLLSARSQNYIIQQIAANTQNAEHPVDEATVRTYFDKGDATILKVFFDEFRKGLNSSQVARARYNVVDPGDLRAKVYSNVGDEEHQWLLSKENTEWKLDLMETLIPDKFPDVAAPLSTPESTVAPAAAAKAFFEALSNDDYLGAWNGLTPDSQDGFVNLVAKGANVSKATVRQAFQAGNKMNDFWIAFRKSSQTDLKLQTGTFNTKTQDGGVALVVISCPGFDDVSVKMFQDNGAWKVGWQETFFPNGMGNP